MRSKAIKVLGILAAVSGFWPLNSTAQADVKFGTCAYWSQPSGGKGKPEWDKFYQIGIAQGVVLGIGVGLHGGLPIDEPTRRMLLPKFVKGFTQLLMRPGTLVDAFDTKCSDYRNNGISLTEVAFVVVLEIGGLEDSRANDAMAALRRGEDREEILRLLTKGSADMDR